MQIRYKIFVYDTSGTKVAEIVDFRGLVIQHTVNSGGYCNIIMDGNNPRLSAFAGRDYLVEIYRSVPDEGIDWYLEFEGLYRTGVRQTYTNGTKTFAGYSVGYLDLLRRRIIAYYAGTAFSSKSGAAETVMKEYVEENAGPSASVANGRLHAGITTGLSIEGDLARGSTWEGERTYRNLLDTLQGISNDVGDMFFDVVGDGAGQFSFRCFPNVRGTDRRFHNVNPATGLNDSGNSPVVFSTQIGNVNAAALSENTSDEVNVVYGLGQGEENSRMVEIAEDTTSIGLSPWNQSEISRNTTAETTGAGVLSAANAFLQTLKATTTLSFELLQTKGYIYGRDFTWGDYVTGRYDEIEQDKFIIGCIITVDEQKLEFINLELGDIPK